MTWLVLFSLWVLAGLAFWVGLLAVGMGPVLREGTVSQRPRAAHPPVMPQGTIAWGELRQRLRAGRLAQRI